MAFCFRVRVGFQLILNLCDEIMGSTVSVTVANLNICVLGTTLGAHGLYVVIGPSSAGCWVRFGTQSQCCFTWVLSQTSIPVNCLCFVLVLLGVCWTLTLRNCVPSPSRISMHMPVWCVASTFRVNKCLYYKLTKFATLAAGMLQRDFS